MFAGPEASHFREVPPAPARRDAPARILFAVSSDHPSIERLRAILTGRISQSGRSQRSLERELGWAHGSLGRILAGKTEISLRHADELATVLGVDALELLREAFARQSLSHTDPPPSDELAPGWIDVLTYEVSALEVACEVFQHLQALIPAPTRDEIARMRSGALPVTRYAYLISQLQSYLCSLENVASDLKVDLEYNFDPQGAEHLENFFNALDTAVERLTPRPAATQEHR
jgi:transcriptional regulator with XRE-family HTH domain